MSLTGLLNGNMGCEMSKADKIKVDLKVPAERANLFVDLGKFQARCLSEGADRDRYFERLVKIWDETSEQLWAWGYWQDYLRCGEIALNCATQLGKRDIEGRILNELGWAQMEQENFGVARECFARSLGLFEVLGDRPSQGQSLRYMGVWHFRQRYFGSTLRLYGQALKVAQDGLSADPLNQRLLHQEAEIHNLLGNLYFKLWNLGACRREFVASFRGFWRLQRSYVSPTPSSYQYFLPVPLLNLGRTAMLAGRYGKAGHYFDRCNRLCERIERQDLRAGVLFRMAELAQLQGETERAEGLAQRAAAVSGKEAPPTRNRAVVFRAQMGGDWGQRYKVMRYRGRMMLRLVGDLGVHAPLVLVQSIGYYSLFLGMRLKAQISGLLQISYHSTWQNK
jgi:tetratricopeptide (TPR) repeat protein